MNILEVMRRAQTHVLTVEEAIELHKKQSQPDFESGLDKVYRERKEARLRAEKEAQIVIQEKAQVEIDLQVKAPKEIENEWYDTILDIGLVETRESKYEKLALDCFNKWAMKHNG